MNRGFTIVEMLVAIFIFAVITTALFSIIPTLYRADRYALQQTAAIDEARRGMKTMLRELREASPGQDGSHMIELAMPNELIFYSDIDQDDKTERIRYYLGEGSHMSITDECVVYNSGGGCWVTMDNYYQGEASNFLLTVRVEGDLGSGSECISLYVDNHLVGRPCYGSGLCSDCAGQWSDVILYDVNDYAQDNHLRLLSDARSNVHNHCDWRFPQHAAITEFTLTWDQTIPGADREFKKGIIDPTDDDIPEYNEDDERTSSISNYIQNAINSPQKSVFYYYDEEGNEIADPQNNLEQISLIKLKLIVNVNIEESPKDYYLESKVKLRSLILNDE
jgi:prepilin-type N-terminal cleavage/methylation domain-containing protein